MPEEKRPTIRTYLVNAVRQRASDLHLQAGSRPFIRVDSKLMALQTPEPLTTAEVSDIVRQTLTEDQYASLVNGRELDYSFIIDIDGPRRFRVNAYYEQGRLGAVIRLVSNEPKTLEELGLPSQTLARLGGNKDGLILVGGATGSGKSTTSSAIVNQINLTQAKRIITIENPIELVHTNHMALISQREVGSDTRDFATALRGALRQDPDVIMIGEIRDRETAAAAMQAAHTGHLVISTIHAGSVDELIGRFTGLFPVEDREEIKADFMQALRGIVIQKLIESNTRDEAGRMRRVPVTEVMVNNARTMQALMSGTEAIDTVIETGERDGMHSFDQDLVRLATERTITPDVALASAKKQQVVLQGLRHRNVIGLPGASTPVTPRTPVPTAAPGSTWNLGGRAARQVAPTPSRELP